ncbi:hypothetical protein EDD66_104215 [Mobilisporobacter senegalensis]|uniref:Uncharacterized protein n=1 Tax=Mobilisporobacter senegalensis TaxID=1329262 RepID=A0A3N1XQT0_9FIRM|nr:hypothetical protein [Mobilisporobacter senegalensis]ROR28628.1 hypothetical protein EDD66_104215 [Mobilisporobacter senegalensis]
MMDLLVLKEKVKAIYQKYGHIIEPVSKFILAVIVFSMINSTLGYDVRLSKIFVVLLLSLLCAFTPISILILLAAALSIGHIYFVSRVLAVMTIVIMFILYFLLLRFTANLSYIVLAIPILYILKIPYVIPILLGLISTPVSIVPMACGVIVYYLFKIIKTVAGIPSETSIEDTLQYYKYVMDMILGNKELLFTIIIFAVVIIITYLIRRQKIDHAFDFAILTGAVINILAFLIVDLSIDVSGQIIIMIIGTIISSGLVYIIQFFRLNLDYTRVENVQFEDDDYYYYVKAVPKINITAPEINVKRINSRKGSDGAHHLMDLIRDDKGSDEDTK